MSNIGKIIHKLRKERKVTLLELSEKSGVALATLSRIENGKMTGTLKSHIEISKALEIPLTDLYKELTPSKTVVARPKADVSIHSKNVSSEMLIPGNMTKKMLPLALKIAKGSSTHKETTKLGVEKFIYVAEGNIEAAIGDEKHNLKKGDVMYFESSLPHYFKNTGKKDARLICVVCPPLI